MTGIGGAVEGDEVVAAPGAGAMVLAGRGVPLNAATMKLTESIWYVVLFEL
jgi:hypothetical protein